MFVFVVEPGAANTKDGAAVRRVIQRADRLGHNPWIPEGVGANHQAELDLLGGGGPGAERHVRLKDVLLRVANNGVQVIPGPEVVGAELVCELRRL